MLTWKFEGFVPIHCKIMVLLIFSEVFSKCTLFGRYCLTSQTPGVYLRETQQCAKSNKAEWEIRVTQKLCFTINSSLKILPCHFRYFHCSSFKMTFEKNLSKRLPFWTFSKFLICGKILHSANRLQLNVYGNTPWIIPEICQKCCFLSA